MKKNSIYMITTVILLIAIAWIFFGNSSVISGTSTGSSTDSGDYQKVVLGMKNGNYYPNTVTVEFGKPVRIYMDSSVAGCYKTFVVPAFGASKYFANSNDYVEFTPDKAGSYGFRCGMGMGTGTLVVK